MVLLAAALFAPLWWCQADPILCMGLWGREEGTELKYKTSHLLFQESPKISSHWRQSKPKGNLTYHQYMPPEPRQGSRADLQAKKSALGPPGPPLWEETNSQQPSPRYDLFLFSRKFTAPESSSIKLRAQDQGNPALGPSSLRTQRVRVPSPSSFSSQESWPRPKSLSRQPLLPHAQEPAS